MYRYRQDLLESNKLVPPKPAAWAIRRSSNSRLPPKSSDQEISASHNFERSKRVPEKNTSKGVSRNNIPRSNKSKRRRPRSPKPPGLFGTIKSALDEDSLGVTTKLKGLEPTIKSLVEVVPKLTQRILSQNKKASSSKAPKIPDDEVDFGSALIPSILQGEKLITVGGYVISLQSVLEHISSMVRPRVSSEKDGLELEIKITGCLPSEIRFEKRYNTLIIIGVVTGPPRRTDDFAQGHHEEAGKVKWKDTMNIIKAKSYIPGKDAFPNSQQQDDNINEIINIFVPKNISLNQIFVTKPDAKGRIFVRGP